ncbi:MAG: sigma 54-dependent Fis family transcriptional regulator [Deltaproteobacteria bacterium]|nr:sigma 54-dependent Fis family transcriptional regulator [Deltaproteobacteria bacterium]
MFEPDRHTEVQNAQADNEKRNRVPASWICRIFNRDGTETTVPIPARGIVIGAASMCDLVVEDAAVSSRHVRLSVSSSGVLVEDLQSTNGTFLRTMRIDKAQVTSQSQVTIGKTVVEISPSGYIDIPPHAEGHFGALVGSSIVMRKCFAVMNLAARSDATVVIEGESGTGKEIAARAIHEMSARANQPFVVVDCAGIPEQLIESHLFGHRAGAFTGAVEKRKGAFVLADEGTIFLDELGELPLAAQAKLLRVLEAQTVQPLGEERPIHVNVRVVAATNRNLEQMVADERFRFDLFHRLAVIRFQMPALRDHTEDIPDLIRHFYSSRNADTGPVIGEGLQQLTHYDWPGNVRELRNVLERAWVLSGETAPPFSKLRFAFYHRVDTSATHVIDTSIPFKEAKEKWLSVFEKQYVKNLITESNGNISKAANHAGLNRNHFRKLMEKYDMIK